VKREKRWLWDSLLELFPGVSKNSFEIVILDFTHLMVYFNFSVG
jgi:hypothetical protein